jgi:hypothetical protein
MDNLGLKKSVTRFSDPVFFGGNAFVSALRADHIFGGNLNPEFWRCFLDEVRTLYEQNPQDFD